MAEPQSRCGQFFKIRRSIEVTFGIRQIRVHLYRRAIPALVIGENEDDIWLRRGGSLDGRQLKRQEETCYSKEQEEMVSLLTHDFSRQN